MMLMRDKLKKVKLALTGIDGLTVYHYWRTGKAPYCIFREDAESGSVSMNNHNSEFALTVYVELFTHMDFDPLADSISDALNCIDGINCRYDGAVYEDQTNLIHHSWSLQVI